MRCVREVKVSPTCLFLRLDLNFRVASAKSYYLNIELISPDDPVSRLHQEEPIDPAGGHDHRPRPHEDHGEAEMKKIINKGSSFESFLEEEGILDEVDEVAVKRLIAWQVEREMTARKLNKSPAGAPHGHESNAGRPPPRSGQHQRHASYAVQGRRGPRQAPACQLRGSRSFGGLTCRQNTHSDPVNRPC